MFPRCVVSADQLTPEVLEQIFPIAETIRQGGEANSQIIAKPLAGKSFALLFWEASTRTYISFFNVIAKLLGGTVVPVPDAGRFSSTMKGEKLPDTIRTCADLGVDGIIMRHPEAGSAQIAADYLNEYAPWILFVNAGDGGHEHPTQMGADLYTIWRNKKELLKNGQLVVALFGELKDSRVFHSDAKALIQYGIRKLILVSEKNNNLPEEILAEAAEKGIDCVKTTDPLEHAAEADVLIFTRLQLERKKVLGKILKLFPFLKSWVKRMYNSRYGMSKKLQAKIKLNALVMHPLPRVGDMPEWMDKDPRAVYLSQGEDTESQVTNGNYFRAALLTLMCS